MIIKTAAIVILGTGVIGTGAVNGITPMGATLAAGPLRVEAGHGKKFTAKLDQPSPFVLVIDINDKRRYSIKF